MWACVTVCVCCVYGSKDWKGGLRCLGGWVGLGGGMPDILFGKMMCAHRGEEPAFGVEASEPHLTDLASPSHTADSSPPLFFVVCK